MSSVAATSTCPACSSDRARGLGLLTEQRYELLGCGACGTQFFRDTQALPHAEDRQYWEAYKFEVYGDEAVRRSFEARYEEMLTLARASVDPLLSVLDVGCGIGNFVHFAAGVGLEAHGVDVSPAAVAAARRRGLQVHSADQLDAAVPDSSVDALTMWDVVEHLVDPQSVLETVLRKVRPGGAVIFETPDGAFPVRRALLLLHRLTGSRVDLTGPMYYWEHKVYFTEQGLRSLLDRAGVDVVQVRRRTSSREKMSCDFGVHARQGSRLSGVLRLAWPLLESAFRVAGKGNKLMIVGVRR